MLKYLLIGLVLGLSGCAIEDAGTANRILPERASSIATNDYGNGTVIIGLAVRHPRRILGLQRWLRADWIQYDPANGQRIGMSHVVSHVACITSSACDSGTDYQIFSVPAGSYSLGWVVDEDIYAVARFTYLKTVRQGLNIIDAEGSQEATIASWAPSFTVASGQIIYVGDLLLNFTPDNNIEYHEKRSDEAARQSLGAEFGAQMVAGGWALSKAAQ